MAGEALLRPLGRGGQNLASFQCFYCDRQMLYKQINLRTPDRCFNKCAGAHECRRVRRKVWRSPATLAFWTAFVVQLTHKVHEG